MLKTLNRGALIPQASSGTVQYCTVLVPVPARGQALWEREAAAGRVGFAGPGGGLF